MESQKGLPLYFKIIIGIFTGVLFAIFTSQAGYAHLVIDWVKPFGDIFLRLMKMIAVPLVLVSIIKGITSISDVRQVGRLATKTIGMYLATTAVAVLIGMSLASWFAPGKVADEEQRVRNRIKYELWANQEGPKGIIDDINYLSDPQYAAQVDSVKVEILEATGQEDVSTVIQEKVAKGKALAEKGPLQPLLDLFPENLFKSLGDNQWLLQVIVFAVLFSICLLLIDQKNAVQLYGFIDGVNDVFIKMVELIMKGAPYFVFALLAGQIAELAGNDPGKVGDILVKLLWYSLTVAGGLGIMILLYPILAKVFGGKHSYMGFLKGIRRAQAVAFSTSSSAATLPVTLDCVENKLGIPKKVSNFVLPIGATVNMDGTSLYQAVAVIFLAQINGVELSGMHYAVIMFTTIMASIGSAAVPGAGVIMLIVVIDALGLNAAWIGLILPVDRILDMFRTVVNVTGDAAVATVVAATEAKSGELENIYKEEKV